MVKTDYNYIVKADELMLGNWITVNASADRKKDFVDKIIRLDESLFQEGRYFAIFVTPEILIENGFKKRIAPLLENVEYRSEDNRVVITNGKDFQMDETIWYVHIDNSDMDSVGNGTFKYLHQLQNILTVNNYKQQFKLN